MQKNHVDEVQIAIRRIIRAIDLQSKKLVQSHGLTGPQALVLKEIGRSQQLTASELAKNVSLSQATITDIVKRLEQRGVLTRERSTEDKRRTHISLTQSGKAIVARSPSFLQEQFAKSFNELKEWEQSQIVYSVQRLAELMNAECIETSPVLASGSVRASAEVIGNIILPVEVAGDQ